MCVGGDGDNIGIGLEMNKNTILALVLLTFAAGMLGLAYAFVPLYKMLCQAFGIPLPSVEVSAQLAAPKPISHVSDRVITITFTGNNDSTMPVRLKPLTYSLKVRLGEPVLTAYHATNLTGKALDGVAVHMLYAMGGADGVNINKYVDLQQCFCFEEQHYPAKQDVTLPLTFTVTPELPAAVHTISFNYTLFPADNVPETMKKPKP